jgi:hypothetical protein
MNYAEDRQRIKNQLETTLALRVEESRKKELPHPQRPTLETYTYTVLTPNHFPLLTWEVEFENVDGKVRVTTYPTKVSLNVGYGLCPLRQRLVGGK